jgi:hypothetical protein
VQDENDRDRQDSGRYRGAGKLDTQLGTLTSVDGVVDTATAQNVYDNHDFQRAIQVYLNSIQIASMSAMRKHPQIYSGQHDSIAV